MQSKYLSLLVTCFCTCVFADDADWPQWRGNHRDGHAAPQALLSEWPEGGPKLRWTYDNAGRGYSSASVVEGRVYTMGARDGQCLVICLSADTGEPIWQTPLCRAGDKDDYSTGWGAGPRSTPTVDGEQIFVLSDIGVLAALSTEGDLQWSTDLVADHGGEIPDWGYSESPLVDGNRVVVTPGGTNFMIAVNRNSGEKIWSSKGASDVAQYVSIMKGTVGSTTYYVTASKPGLLAFDASSGRQLFRNGATGNGIAVIPTPIVIENQIYHTSDYGAGNTLLTLTETGTGQLEAESVYHLSDKTMRNHHGGVVLLDGVIYGFSKANGGVWMAQDLQTGETLWEEKIRGNRSGSITLADGRLYCYNDKEGSVILVDPNSRGWSPKGKLTLPAQTELERGSGAIWTHPIVANQMLIVRDQDLIYAYDIAKER